MKAGERRGYNAHAQDSTEPQLLTTADIGDCLCSVYWNLPKIFSPTRMDRDNPR
jgi:hypothetical protein